MRGISLFVTPMFTPLLALLSFSLEGLLRHESAYACDPSENQALTLFMLGFYCTSLKKCKIYHKKRKKNHYKKTKRNKTKKYIWLSRKLQI